MLGSLSFLLTRFLKAIIDNRFFPRQITAQAKQIKMYKTRPAFFSSQEDCDPPIHESLSIENTLWASTVVASGELFRAHFFLPPLDVFEKWKIKVWNIHRRSNIFGVYCVVEECAVDSGAFCQHHSRPPSRSHLFVTRARQTHLLLFKQSHKQRNMRSR